MTRMYAWASPFPLACRQPQTVPGRQSRRCDRLAIRDAFRQNLTIMANDRQRSTEPLFVLDRRVMIRQAATSFRPANCRLPAQRRRTAREPRASVFPATHQVYVTLVTLPHQIRSRCIRITNVAEHNPRDHGLSDRATMPKTAHTLTTRTGPFPGLKAAAREFRHRFEPPPRDAGRRIRRPP
jgi:hypothetical protein